MTRSRSRLQMAAVAGLISLMTISGIAVGSAASAAPTAPGAPTIGAKPVVLMSNTGQEVRRLYRAYFLREPDQAGLEYWVRLRSSGVPLHQVSSEFARSAEFRRTYGALDNSGFLDLVYRNVMGRQPDAAGHRYWVDHLNRGMSRGELMVQFSESREFKALTGTPGVSNIASNVNVGTYLVRPWEPNLADTSWEPSGSFRMFCSFSHLAFADPIVAPGNDRFAHLHMFFGNTRANHASTYSSLRSGGDSTCDGGPLNRTAYWMPAVFDGSGRVVVPNYFELYYKGENTGSGTLAQKQNQIRAVESYPNGLRMIAGAPGGSGTTWGWRCGDSGSSRSTIPDCPSGVRLTAWVRFPYCWDGRNLDSPDHRSHMAYGTNNTWGGCPASHPVHLPELTEMAHFEAPAGSSQWYLSSDRMGAGAPNGSTFHADWFGAWDNGVQDRWVQNCIRGMRSASNGNLCDGQQLRPAPNHSGPTRITGWRPTP